MKLLCIGLIILMFSGFIAGSLIPKKEHRPVAVDLPEEYEAFSQDSNHPDTVLAFYDNDTVYIQTLGK